MVPEYLPIDDGYEHRTAVVVASCSRYRQVWRPFFVLFKKYWSDCPYVVFFVADENRGPLLTFEGVRNIALPHDGGWCTNMILALNSMPNIDRVILFQEDFLLTSKAETQVVRQLVQYAHDMDIGCLRLCPCPGPDKQWIHDFLGEISLDATYRVSLQLTIWKRSVLTSLMKHGETPWVFEVTNGRARSVDVKEPFLSLWRQPDDTPGGPIRYFITAVTKGVWEKGALELLKREGIPMNGITGRID